MTAATYDDARHQDARTAMLIADAAIYHAALKHAIAVRRVNAVQTPEAFAELDRAVAEQRRAHEMAYRAWLRYGAALGVVTLEAGVEDSLKNEGPSRANG